MKIANMELVCMLFTVRLFKYGIGGTCYLLSDYSNMELMCMLFTVRLFKYGIGVHAIYCQIIQIWNWCTCYLLSDYSNMELVVHAIYCQIIQIWN